MSGQAIVRASDGKTLSAQLQKAEGTLATLFGSRDMAIRAWKVAYVLVRRTPDLQKCSVESIVNGLLQSAQYKLELGVEAYLVPFGTEAQFIPDWKGLVRLAIRAGAITGGHADLVYEGDVFTYRRSGDAVEFFHEPKPFGKRALKDTVDDQRKAGCLGVYFIGYRKTAPPIIATLSLDEVEYVRNTYSKAKNGDLWAKRWSMGAFKTAAKQAMKLATTSPELQEVIEHDNRLETGIETGVLPGDEAAVAPYKEPQPKAVDQEAEIRAEDQRLVERGDVV